ncbi:MAG: exodeoxyribonuclease III [Chitinophagales bacterium]
MAAKKFISFNVNGIRASVKKGFYETVEQLDADFICLQETKAQDDQVIDALKDLNGYHMVINSALKKGYSGTCILSKEQPISTSIDMDNEEHDQEGRITRAEFENYQLVNVYVPNSGSGLKRLDYRATWDEAFTDYLVDLNQKKPLIITGDFNVAREPIDLANPKSNYNKTSGYTQVEIDGFNNLLDKGFIDTFRTLHPDTVKYSFWNQRFNARKTNAGWRIDYFLVPVELKDKVISADILNDIYGSDHCPVELVMDL